MRLHHAAQRVIDEAQTSGHDLVYLVSEDKTTRYPWRLSLRYWTADPVTSSRVPTKVGLRWFRTPEQAYEARDSLQAQEALRVSDDGN